LNETKEFIGCLALNHINKINASAEMELWIGEPWQRQGFAREATKEMLTFAFHQLKLNRIFCYHLSKDPKSRQLLGKLGFQVEGTLRQAIYKWNRYEDLQVSARLKDDLLD
jgi:RimJ/RimL family protein N-acetyltransferase